MYHMCRCGILFKVMRSTPWKTQCEHCKRRDRERAQKARDRELDKFPHKPGQL